jgi:RNA polymerase sigma factor (sigma-70 family)
MEQNDAQLVSESILGKQGSFELLVSKYTTPIYNFVFRLTGNTQTAEDLTQETFVKIWKSLKRYDQKQVFRSWAFTIARNTVTDYMRKKKTVPFSMLSGDDEHSFEETLADETDLPDELITKIDDAETLTEFLDQLSPDHKTVMILHYQENMTFDEIGKIVNKPLNTVKSHHRRALEKLRELLAPKTL